MQMLQGKSKLWAEISRLLGSSGQLGAELPLGCKKHDKHLKVSKADQFPPEGGCFELCSELMKCGHTCLKLCHVNYDPAHEEVKCMAKCTRSCSEGQPCSKLCKDPCLDCKVTIWKLLPCTHEQEAPCFKPTLPNCGHGVDVACGADITKVKCPGTCERPLDCGHACPENCHIEELEKHKRVNCQEPCQRTCSRGHPCLKKCFQMCGLCRVREQRTLPCGHQAVFACFVDLDKAFCREKVQKILSACQHSVEVQCSVSTDDMKCYQPCERVLCVDGHPCKKKCFEPCGLCNISVERELRCGHRATMQCHFDPAKVKCRKRKQVKLPACGHTATIHCGEDPAVVHCPMKCDIRLECGHTCVRNCHSNDNPSHENYNCKKPCSRLKHGCKKNHKCGRKCFENCPPCDKKWNRTLPCGHTIFTECKHEDSAIFCRFMVRKTIAECGHDVLIECSHLPTVKDCAKPCAKILKCGHRCAKRCCEPCNSDDCKQLVPTSIANLCGHNLNVECSVFTKQGGEVNEDQKKEHLRKCQEPCRDVLECGHPCRGTCGECFNGRVHVPCQQDCGRNLICGHSCQVSCASSCPPCRMPCEQKCVHSECRHMCGLPCSPCQEACVWRCCHYRCSKRCGDFCDRPACNEPCKKALKCGHPCVGLCGELCPQLCRTCHNEELTEIHFGNEADENARFIYLPDCKHCVEVGAMDVWMNQNDDGQIKPKCCPRCKTVVQNCLRYGNIIKQTLQDVSIVKRRILNERSTSSAADFLHSASAKLAKMKLEIRNLATLKLEQWNVVQNQLNESLDSVFHEALAKNKNGKFPPLPDEKRFYLKAGIDFFSSVLDLINAILKELRVDRDRAHVKLLAEPMAKELTRNVSEHLLQLVRLFTSSDRLSPRSYSQFVQEMDRIDYLRAYYALQSTSSFRARGSSLEEKKVLDQLLVFNVRALDSAQKKEIETTLKSLAKQLRTGLGITKKEREEIVGAMNLKLGHWFKCPNGHIYAIGDCGGAMVESRCNECDARIGGANHVLLASNSLAPEMDGAARPAWS